MYQEHLSLFACHYHKLSADVMKCTIPNEIEPIQDIIFFCCLGHVLYTCYALEFVRHVLQKCDNTKNVRFLKAQSLSSFFIYSD